MQNITNNKSDGVRMSSLLFKEQNYGNRKWEIENATNGFVNLFPFFAFST